MSKIDKALVIGLGSIGRRHLRNLQRLFPQIKVAVLRSNEKPGVRFIHHLRLLWAFPLR